MNTIIIDCEKDKLYIEKGKEGELKTYCHWVFCCSNLKCTKCPADNDDTVHTHEEAVKWWNNQPSIDTLNRAIEEEKENE